MPLYREWSSDPYSLAAIWKIEEPESFFTERTGLPAPDIKAEKRRMERMAGRFLLKHLKEDFPLLNIRPDEHDKPRIDDNQYYFSISHSWPYVAAVISPYVECGIDIQCWHPRMEALQHKFLSPTEQSLFNNDAKLLTLAWCAKEAAYKWQGRRGVEFADHMTIEKIERIEHDYNINIFMHLTNPQMQISAQGIVKQDFACSFIIHEQIIHPFENKTKLF
jgi:phosphopantetheinyl transferase